ncbi:MAG: hypothetical protein AAGA77_12320 [Bacteroidota bacterium]
MKNGKDKYDKLPDWLRLLRGQTWQIEILIAGSTVYTLFYLSDYIRSFFYSVYPGIDFSLTRTITLFGVYIVTRILLIGFIANLIIRAVWLAYLGINFAFPQGVNFDNLNNNEESKRILKSQATILNRVTFLELLSKLSYSLAILLAIFMTSVFITTVLVHFVLEEIGFGSIIYEAWFSYMVAIIVATIQIGVIDRIMLSQKSKRPLINKIKKWVSVFLEYFTLSFLFRREFLAIKSNTNKWVLGLSVSFILTLSSLITSYQIGKYWSYGTFKMKFLDDREYYDIDYDPYINIYDYDENITENKSVLRVSIPSMTIKSRYLKVFVTSWGQFDKMLLHGFNKHDYPLDYESKNNEDYLETKQRADSIFNLVINDLFIVEIDNVKQERLRWKTTRHPKSKTKGYVTFVDIEKLKNKEHKLQVFVNYFDRKNKIQKGRWKDIYFWKE